MTELPAEPGRRSRSPLHLFAVVTAFLLPVLFSPSVASYFWLPKAAYLVLVGGVGLPLVIGMAWRDRRGPALAGVAFIGAEAVSSVLSSNHTTAVFGAFGASDGLLFWIGVVGAWAIGRHVSSAASREVAWALLAGAAVNAIVALAETAFDLTWYHLTLFDGRPPGLMANPVHLSALLAGCLALVTAPWIATRFGVALAALFAAGLQAAGGRLGLAIGVVVLGVGLLRRPRRIAVMFVVAAAVGVVFGTWVAGVRGTTSASQQLSTEPTGGLSDRLENWKSAVPAIADRPLFGWGPDRFQAATSPHRTRRLSTSGPDRVFEDAHNLVINMLVTVGVVGLMTFLAFAWLVWWRVPDKRSPLLLFALAILATHLLEPGLAGTTPLAFMGLGLAGGDAVVETTRRVRLSAAALGLVALAAAMVSVFGGFELEQARLDYSLVAVDRANDFLPRWSNTAGLKARIKLFNGKIHHDPVEIAASIRWREEAVRRDPANPSLWNDLGDVLAGAGRYERAIAAYKEALPRNPWSVRALANIALLEVVSGRPSAGRAYVDRALMVADSGRLRALRDATRQGGGSPPPPSG